MADKKEYATRFGMAVLAGLFLITSVGFSLLVIWQTKEQHKKDAALTAANTAAAKSTNPTTKGGTALQGTQLNNFTPIESITSLQKIDTVAGTGDTVQPGQTVVAHYTGAVAATGVIFQSSHDGEDKPVSFSLSGVIKGWTDGVPGMQVGGTRRLLIPASEAYGANPPAGSGIPANADLVFDVELVSIAK